MARRGRDRALYELVLSSGQLRLALVVIALSLVGAFAAGGMLGFRWAKARARAAQDAALAVRQSVHELTQPEPEPRDPEDARVEASIEELIPASPREPTERATATPPVDEGMAGSAADEEPDVLAGGATVAEPFSLPADRSGRLSRGSGSWLVQVLATPSELEARQLADELSREGFPAFVSVTRDGDRTFFRVRVGTFAAKTDADRAAAELRHEHRLDTWVFD